MGLSPTILILVAGYTADAIIVLSTYALYTVPDAAPEGAVKLIVALLVVMELDDPIVGADNTVPITVATVVKFRLFEAIDVPNASIDCKVTVYEVLGFRPAIVIGEPDP